MNYEICDHNLATTLRTVSLHEKNGILMVCEKDRSIEVGVISGKIVQVCDNSIPLGDDISRRMKKLGMWDEDFDSEFSPEVAIPALYRLLVGRGVLSHEMFVHFKFAYERDVLLSLRELAEPEVEFYPQLIHSDPELSQSIYPCQLLLDILELSLNENRFSQIFAEGVDDLFVSRVARKGYRLTQSESVVWEMISQGAMLRDVVDAATLSIAESMEALLSLRDAELVVIGHQDEFSDRSEEDFFLSSDLFDSTIATFDNINRAELEAIATDSDLAEVERYDDQFELLQDNSLSVADEESASYISDDPSAEIEVELPLPEIEQLEQLNLEEEQLQHIHSGERVEKGLRIYLLSVIVSYLVVSGLVLPQKLSELFDALSVFAN